MSKGVARKFANSWKIEDAVETYGINLWGKDYFGINAEGHVTVHPTKRPDQAIDLKELVDQLQARGIQLPILLRFTDILRHRVGEIHDAFRAAIREYDYEGSYCCVYPIKVNQQRHVVEEILDFGKPFHFGLEAGSKPELLAVLALTDLETPIICNGFKDDEFIKMTMLARKIGKQIIPVVEKFTELEVIVRHAQELNVRPVIGVRAKLASRGAGRWKSSAGLPVEVRPDPDRGPRGVRVPQAARHGRLLPAAPLPPRQPDHQHPQHQGGPDRGGADVRRAGAGRRRGPVPRRRRRPRHRLRRLADRLRLLGQLHAPGIRQRRRLPHQERLRRGRGQAPDDHLRVGPGGGRLPQRARLRRARRVELRRATRPPPRSPTTPRSRSPTSSASTASSPRRTPWRATTTPCRRSTRR